MPKTMTARRATGVRTSKMTTTEVYGGKEVDDEE